MLKRFSLVAMMMGVLAAAMAQDIHHSFTRPLPLLLAQAAVSSSTSPEPQPQVNPLDTGPLPSPSPHVPSVQELDQMFKQTPLGKAADEARLHAQWRELSNQTISEPDLVAARAHAEAASTDLEKRQRMRAYYAKYFDRLYTKAQTPELKNYIEMRKMEHLNLLAQNRVRPGFAPVPTPRPSASAAPSIPPEPALPRQ